MKITTKLFFIFLFFLFNSTGIAQEVHSFQRPMDTIASTSKGTFSSLQGRFSISLPKSSHGYNGTDGGLFPWRLNEGYYYIGYTDREQDIENSNQAEEKALQIAKDYFNKICRDLLKTYPSTVNPSNKSIKFENHPGIELRIEMPNGLGISRVFWAKSRAYVLVVLLVGDQRQYEKTVFQVFDSLKLDDKNAADAIIKKKTEEATPKALPQTPIVKKLKSDAEDDGLKGRIKSVIVEMQGLSGQMVNKTRRYSTEIYFDERGNQVKRILYNTDGQPTYITVYGSIDNKRVSVGNSVDYESNPPPIRVLAPPAPAGKPQQKADTRYDNHYEYDYDEKGNLIEKRSYRSNGDLSSRYVYKYSENKIEGINYNGKDNSINSRHISIKDDNGSIIESTYFDTPMDGWDEKLTYKYEEFDSKGNWTKRVETLTRIYNGQSKVEWSAYEIRTITYY